MSRPKRTAIVYFSLNGNTEYVAERIYDNLEDQTMIDVIKLEPVKPYVDKGPMKFVKGGAASVFGAKPELVEYQFDPKEYDTVIIGTPVWAGSIAPPLRSFLLSNKLKGKNVAIFLCSSSGKVEKCMDKLKKYLKKSAVVTTLSLLDPAKAKSGEDLYEIQRFVGEVARNKK